MNAAEIGSLLGLMSMYDNRKPPKDSESQMALIAAWDAVAGDLDYADAQQAVKDHYRETREWMMPADVRRRVLAMRAARRAVAPVADPPPELAGDEPGYRQWLADQRDRTSAAGDHRALEAGR